MRKIILILLFCLFQSISEAGFAPIQSSAQTSGTGATVNNTVVATKQNSLLVVHIRVNSTAETCSSVTDDKGNTYGLIGPQDVGGGGAQRQYMAYGVQVIAGVTTVTGNFSGTAVSKTIGVDEFTGCQPTNATCFDTSLSDQGGGSSMAVGFGGLVPSSRNELIVSTGTINNSLVWTATGSGYSLYNGSNPNSMRSQYKINGTLNETGPLTLSGDSFGWTEIIACFKPAPEYTTTFNTKVYNTKIYG